MNKRFLILACSAILIILNDTSLKAQEAKRFPIDTDWTFNYIPDNKVKNDIILPGFDDSTWKAIALPHTWSTYETTGDQHPFIKNPSEQDDPYWWKGWGYYRKKIHFDKTLRDKKVWVEFDGVQKYCRIYLNGRFIEDHKGGFTSFYVDLTDKIEWGKENVLVVAVNNRRDDPLRIPPMTAGNWNVYGGIYRAVRIRIKDKLHVPFQGSYKHEGGIFVTTRQVSREKAIVLLKTHVKNEHDTAMVCTLENLILNPAGAVVTRLQTTKTIAPGSLISFDQQATLSNPELWSPGSPNLYRVATRILYNGTVVDELESPLGIRWFHWDYSSNDLFVNGEKLNIKGINRHQEYPWLGDAIPLWITRMDLVDIRKNLGHNFMRAGHYPNDPYFYHLADSLGIIMIEEVPNIKSLDFSEEVQEQNVREMIRRDRNHPSIFFWSMGNETSDAADSRWAVEEDTTRIIHLRKGEGGGDFVQHTDKNLDLEQLLRVSVRGWFDQDDAPPGISSTPENGQFASNETWQWKNAMVLNGSTRGILGHNCSAWLYEDHGCDREYLNAPVKHINAKGWVDAYREPKYIYHLTKALQTNEPVINLHQHVWRQQNLGQLMDIVVDSNCEEVELFINKQSRGKRFPLKQKFPTVTFENVRIEEGEIKVVGVRDGDSHHQTIQMAGKPAAILLETSQKTIPADRSGIALVKASIVDGEGNPVSDASNTLNWRVSGAGTLVGMSVYESDINKHEAMEGSGYTVAPVSNVVRAGASAGLITVVVTSPELDSALLTIQAIDPQRTVYAFLNSPKLLENGRKPVKRDGTYAEQVTFREEIKLLPGNVFLTGHNDSLTLRQVLADLMVKNNPGLQVSEAGFKTILIKMADRVMRQNGELVADDYNFTINIYNQFLTLRRLIDSKNFHSLYASLLTDYYRKNLLERNKPLSFTEEFKSIEGFPTKLVALLISPPDKSHSEGTIARDNVQNTIQVYAKSPIEALLILYPEFKDFNSETRLRCLRLIAEINPHIRLKDDKIIHDPLWTGQQESTLVPESARHAQTDLMVFVPALNFLEQP